jgi:ATP-dependent DNA ligase
MLQNYGFSEAPIFYYAFELLILAGRDITSEPLEARCGLLRRHVLTTLQKPIR